MQRVKPAAERPTAVVAPRCPPAIGGVERHVEMVVRGLAHRGIPVELIATDPSGRLPRHRKLHGVHVRQFPTVANDVTYYMSPPLGWWLLRHAHEFALLHAHSYHTLVPLIAALAACRARVPLVITPHYHGTGHSRFRRALHPPYRLLAGRWIMRLAEVVICVSRSEERLIRTHFGHSVRTAVVPNGIDVDELRLAQPDKRALGRTLVLSAGRLEQYKQVDRLIAAAPHLPPTFDIVIAGSGPEQTRLGELARQLGAGQRVRLVGNVPREELISWYRSADVFVTMSREESFGLAALEGAAAGARVVASDIPAHREVAQLLPAGAMTFAPLNSSPTSLAAAIAACGELGRLSDEMCSIPSWERVVDMTLACYQTAVARQVNKDRGTSSRAGNPSLWARWRQWRLANR